MLCESRVAQNFFLKKKAIFGVSINKKISVKKTMANQMFRK